MRVVLLVAPLGFCLGMGLLGLIRPAFIPSLFTPNAPDHGARNEIRAVYGGFGLGCAGVIGTAMARSTSTTDGMLIALSVAFASMAIGRIVGLIAEPSRFSPLWALVILEIGLAAAIGAAASQ